MKKLIFIGFIFSTAVFGGNADLSIALEFNENNGVVYENFGHFVARITNNGPDVAGLASTRPNPISLSSGIIQDNGSLTPDIQFAAASQNNSQICYFLLAIGEPPPGGSVSYAYSIHLPPLNVGETIECFGIYSTHFETGFREVNWSVRNSLDTDPVSENNAQRIVFGIPPSSVPAFNFYLLLALITSTLFIGVKYTYNRTKV